MYILEKYGTFEGKDFYFTNQELFGGASTVVGAIRANSKFIARQIRSNIERTVGMVPALTELRKLFPHPYLAPLFLVAILYGAFRAGKDELMRLFVVGNLLLVGAAVLAMPKQRYMVPLIPVFILSASWYGRQLGNIVAMKSRTSTDPLHKVQQSLSLLIVFLVLAVFSHGATNWASLTNDMATDLQRREFRMLEKRTPPSMKASFDALNPLVQDCKGVLSLESTFVGAFMDVSLDKVYDVWEIPPFGRLGHSGYKGLTPDRIDCLLISHELATGVGFATNFQIRYQNYIRPYARQLQAMGAATYDIPRFGQAVILHRP